MQISLARYSECPVWYFPVQSRLVQCSPVRWSPVPSSSVFWSGPAQSSPVRSTDVRSSPFSEICARPVQFQFIPYQLRTFKSSIAQVPTTQQSSLVQSSAVQSSAIRSSSAVPARPSRPKQLTTVESSTTQRCSVKLGTTKCIAARPVKWSTIRKSPHWSHYKCVSPVLSSVVTLTQSRASTYGIVVDRSFLMIP